MMTFDHNVYGKRCLMRKIDTTVGIPIANGTIRF